MRRRSILFCAYALCFVLVLPASGQSNDDVTVYKKRRQAVLEKMPRGGVMILKSAPVAHRNGDVDYEYRQDSDFYYLTGFHEPEAALVLSKNGIFLPDNNMRVNELLFLRERNPRRERWDGYRLGVDAALEALHVQAALPIDQFNNTLDMILRNADSLYIKTNRRGLHEPLTAELDLIRRARERLFEFVVADPGKILVPMRQRKDSHELELLKKAIEITGLAHREAMRSIKPGMFEYELEAVIEYNFKKNGSERAGFPSIVGSGPNSCILHYNTNRRQMQAGDVVVVDIGAEYGMYTADITRTIPVSGKFTDAQRKIYEIVLEAQEAGIAAAIAGAGFRRPYTVAFQKITEGLQRLGILNEESGSGAVRDFLPHGVSHYIGLDVHDVGAYGSLQPGEVITVEPGIYITEELGKKYQLGKEYWNLGVRIEDDILITQEGPVLLSHHAPRKPDEIERLIAGEK